MMLDFRSGNQISGKPTCHKVEDEDKSLDWGSFWRGVVEAGGTFFYLLKIGYTIYIYGSTLLK